MNETDLEIHFLPETPCEFLYNMFVIYYVSVREICVFVYEI